MKDEWTTDVSDIPEHILKNHIEVQKSNTKKHLAYEVEFYRKNGYPTRKIRNTKYKSGANLITGHKESSLNGVVGSGTLNTSTRDRSLNGIKF